MVPDIPPLFAEKIFLYDGNRGSDGISDYDAEHYRDHYTEVDFIEPHRLLDSLDDDLITKHRDFLDVIDNATFVIPNYQRYYSWEVDQHQELWEEVLRIIHLSPSVPEKPPENFFGTIYLGKLGDRGTFEVIDGQQRLTTITLLLFQIRNHLESRIDDISGDKKEFAEHVKNEWLDGVLLRQSGPIKQPFLEPNDHDDEYFQILFKERMEERLEAILDIKTYDGRRRNAVPRRDVVEAYSIPDSVIEDRGVEDDVLDEDWVYFAESHKLLIEAADFYDKKLNHLFEGEEHSEKRFPSKTHEVYALINLTMYLLRSFRLAEIQFQGDNRELRVNVFQELNDKGKDLSTMDKIKARIVSLFQDSTSYDVSDKLKIWESIVENFNGRSSRVEDFLVYYIAATRNPDDLTTARGHLLDLFRLNKVGEPEFEPMLVDEGKGSDFLDELYRYSERYVEILHHDLSGGTNQLNDETQKVCQEIIRRLDDLNTSQWIPFVLFLYDHVSDTPGKDEFFKQVMKTVENITFRVSLTELNATVIDTTYISAANSFRERLAGTEGGDPYDIEEVQLLLVEGVPNRRQLTGDTFVQNLIMEYDWKPNKSKQLLLKIIDEGFAEDETGIVRREIDGDVELEHIFPTQFIRGWDTESSPSENDPYAWIDDFFYGDDSVIVGSDKVIDSLVEQLKSDDAARISKSDPEYDNLNRIVQQITSLFVNDIGNMMLLAGGLNGSIQNKRFSVKLQSIHERHAEDLKNRGNRFFSRESRNIPEDKLDELLETELSDDDTDPKQDIEKYFNKWWNLTRLVERKADLIVTILDSLEYDVGDDEFAVDPDEIRDLIVSDIENRCDQPV